MGRYDSPAEIESYRAKKPQRFDDYEDYVAPVDGVVRAVDEAPVADEGGRQVVATRGFAHLKGR